MATTVETLYISEVDGTLTQSAVTGSPSSVGCGEDEWRDGSDGSYYSVGFDGDADTITGEGYSRYEYAQGASVVADEPFYKVRVRIRARRQLSGGLNTIQPSIGGTARGTPTAATDSFAWYEFDFLTDPADSAAWTAAKINGYAWGWYAYTKGSGPSNDQRMWIAEYEILASTITTTIGTVESRDTASWPNDPTLASGNIAGSYRPEAASQLLAVIRPSSGDMGDQNYATSDNPASVGLNPPGTGTSVLVAPTMTDTGDLGVPISEIEIRITGECLIHLIGGRLGTVPVATRFKWAVSTDAATQVAASQFTGESSVTLVSARIPLQPNGSAWSWAAIDGLINVGLECDWDVTAGSHYFQFLIQEIQVDVYGAIGAVGPPVQIKTTQTIGKGVLSQEIGTGRATLTVGANSKKLGTVVGPITFPQ